MLTCRAAISGLRDIVQFEKNSDNLTVVYQRKKLWGYIEEIKSDKYSLFLSKEIVSQVSQRSSNALFTYLELANVPKSKCTFC